MELLEVVGQVGDTVVQLGSKSDVGIDLGKIAGRTKF